eukprot:scaffold581_cov263-Pinguiococcus_pyrenoidosus.AAC.18
MRAAAVLREALCDLCGCRFGGDWRSAGAASPSRGSRAAGLRTHGHRADVLHSETSNGKHGDGNEVLDREGTGRATCGPAAGHQCGPHVQHDPRGRGLLPGAGSAADLRDVCDLRAGAVQRADEVRLHARDVRGSRGTHARGSQIVRDQCAHGLPD